LNIDVHGHVVVQEILRSEAHPEGWRPEVVRDSAGRVFVRNDYFVNGPIPKEIVEWPKIIENLDATQVDVMAVSPSPFLFFYYLDPQAGLYACQVQNDAIAQAVAQYPRRLVGMGIVPLQDVRLAVKELERVVRELKMPAVEVGSNVLGAYLGEERFWPFWEAVETLDVFVFVHPEDPIGKDRLGPYYLINLVGNPIETARCIADVVFSGLLDRFPRLKLCFAHGGGAAPYIMGRFDHGFRMRNEPKANIARLPSEYMHMLYYDTITHYGPALEYLVQCFGPEHVVLASDYPFDMGPQQPVEFVRSAGLAEDVQRKILGENALRLLKLDPSAFSPA
jgi:aminocarboxymuconate-semialdehyde decarboxylase